MSIERLPKWSASRIVAQALLELLWIPLALFGAPVAVFFAQWDSEPTTWTGGAADNGPPTVRGDLPWWLSWFQTFDERLPGGMYEPTVVKVYNAVGRYWCSVYWLVVRNRMFGLEKALFGKPADRYEPWLERRQWWRIEVVWGWKQYRATPQAHWANGPFVLVPSFSVGMVGR